MIRLRCTEVDWTEVSGTGDLRVARLLHDWCLGQLSGRISGVAEGVGSVHNYEETELHVKNCRFPSSFAQKLDIE